MIVQVAAAIIKDKAGRILIGRRKQAPNDSCAGLWEFPGGKVEAGESQAQCLVRECQEELGLKITVGERYASVRHTYPERTVEVSFWLALASGSEVITKVHAELRWIWPQELGEYAFCPANADVIARLLAETQKWQ